MTDTPVQKYIIKCQILGCKNEVEGVRKHKRTCFTCKRKRIRASHHAKQVTKK